MPLLFAITQHGALAASQESLQAGERLVFFLDDIYTVTLPERVGPVNVTLQAGLWRHARITVHGRKTKVWNFSGERPEACDELERVARLTDPEAIVWRGPGIPADQQGIKVLRAPIGHLEFLRRQVEIVSQEHQTFLSRIPHVQKTQCAWLLLAHSASARANCLLRVMHPEAVEEFARKHDAGLWQCLCDVLGIDPGQETTVKETAVLPMSLGRLGLRSAVKLRVPAFWASWADCLPMILERHPTVVHQLMAELEEQDTPILHAVAASVRSLTGVRGFEPPTWHALAAGARPEPREPDDYEPGSVRKGWQHEVASRVEEFGREDLFTRVGEDVQALVRSQGGPGAGLVLSTCPTCRVTKLETQLFRVVLLRRLRLPLPLTVRTCRCGLPLDPCGHHRAACAHAGVLGRRGWALENVLARICREAGGRVATNVMVRDLDLALPHVVDGRRLEVVVDGLPLYGGAQLSVDTSFVRALHRDGRPRRRAAVQDGVALTAARRRKEALYPELVGRGAGARLVARRRTHLRKPMWESSDSDAPLLPARETTFTVVPREHGGIPSRLNNVAVVALDVDDSEQDLVILTGHSRGDAHEKFLDEFQQDLLRRTAAIDHDALMSRPSWKMALVPESEGGHHVRSRTGWRFRVQSQPALRRI